MKIRKRTVRRWFALFLALTLCMGMPISVFADDILAVENESHADSADVQAENPGDFSNPDNGNKPGSSTGDDENQPSDPADEEDTDDGEDSSDEGDNEPDTGDFDENDGEPDTDNSDDDGNQTDTGNPDDNDGGTDTDNPDDNGDGKDSDEENENVYSVRFSVEGTGTVEITVNGEAVDISADITDLDRESEFTFGLIPGEDTEIQKVSVSGAEIEELESGYAVKNVTMDEVVVRVETAVEEPVADKIPEAVQAFLDAVAALPSADKVNAENAEEIGNQVKALLDMWEALDGSLSGREDVSAALEKVYEVYEAVLAAEEIEEGDFFLAQIPGFTPADRFYDKNGKEVAQLYVGTYPNNPVYKYNNPATAIEIKVGEKGYDQRLYTKSVTCHCGNVLVEVTPDWFAVDSDRKLTNSDKTIVKDLSWNLAGYEEKDSEDEGYGGYPALQLNVVGAKPGSTEIKFQAYENYYYYYTWQQCRRCGQRYSEISFKGKWIEDTDIVNVTVKADYELKYDTQGGSPVASTLASEAETTATLHVTKEIPILDGFNFMGWANEPDAETADYQSEEAVDLEWSEGYGSTGNPVSKTLYAVWEKDGDYKNTSYTVIREYYVDYVDEENPGEKAATVTGGKISGEVGEEIIGKTLADGNPEWNKYSIDGEEYEFTYKGSNPEKLILVKDETQNIITLRYVIMKVVTPGETPTPTPTATPTPTESPVPSTTPTPTEAPTPTEEPTPTEAPTPTDEPTPTEAPAPTDEPTPTEAPTTPPVTPTETPEPPTPTATPEVPAPPAPQEPEPPAELEEPEPPTPPTLPTRVIEVVPEVPEVVTPDGPDTLVVIPDEDVARAVVYERVVNPVTEETTYELNEEISVMEEVPEAVTIDSPDTVIILDEEVPQAYVKTQDPVTEDYVYIPEEDVPLASIGTPQTGDATGNHWMMLFMMSLGGMIFLLPDVIHRKKNR